MTSSRRILRLLACAGLAVWLAAPAAAQRLLPEPGRPEASRTVRVDGDAEVLVVPDEAVLRLGVQTLDADLETALAENARAAPASRPSSSRRTPSGWSRSTPSGA